MTSTSKNIKQSSEEANIASDTRYASASCALISQSLRRGCDVMQMSNGDIVITELRPVTFKYTWDDKKAKLHRRPYGNRAPQTKPRKAKTEVDHSSELVMNSDA